MIFYVYFKKVVDVIWFTLFFIFYFIFGAA